MADRIKVIHSDCDASLAKDKSLPNNSCLVIYIENNKRKYDIVMSQKMVSIFDEYWDRYKDNLISILYTEGRVNPRMWGIEKKEDKKK